VGAEGLRIEVAYARPDWQFVVALQVPAGTTALQAVERSGLLARCPELTAQELKLGVFGKPVSAERVLAAGERVEIYRPLQADPKEVRRQRAAEGRTMGKPRSGG
jgi:putative ubiquitin-RnfH superfamily antitoxin RatB of RatAB toxin-antitoxin module